MHAYALPSGMRIIFQEDHSSPTVSIATIVGTGSAQDPPEKAGISHMIEHLAFLGTAGTPATARERLERIGAQVNAETNRDYVMYHAVAPKSSLAALLAIDARRLIDPLEGVDERAFLAELEVVRNEVRYRAEMPLSGIEYYRMMRALFPGEHPYSRSPGGTQETIDTFTLEEARAFAAKHYRPDNMTMVIAGDFDPKETAELIQARLPEEMLAANAQPAARTFSTERKEPPAIAAKTEEARRMKITAENLEYPEITIGWTVPGGYRSDSELESSLLYFSLSEVMRYALFVGKRDVMDVDVEVEPGLLAKVVMLKIKVREKEDLPVVTERALKHLYWLEYFLLSYGHTNVLRIALSSYARSSENQLARAASIAQLAHFTGSADLYGSLAGAVENVGRSEMTDLVQSYLTADRAHVLWVEPGASTEVRTPRERVAQGHAASSIPRLPIDRLLASRIDPEVRSFTLDNGLRVHLVSRPNTISAVGQIVFYGGAAANKVAGEQELLDAVFSDGHDERWFDYGGQFFISTRDDEDRWVAQVPGGNVENLVEVLSMTAKKRGLSSVHFATIKEHWPESITRGLKDPVLRAERNFTRLLYGEHVLGRVLTTADIDRLELDELQSRLDRLYRPENAELVLVGPFSLLEIEPLVRRHFGGWKMGDVRRAAPVAPFTPAKQKGPRYALVDRTSAPQFSIRLGCTLPKIEDYAAFAVAEALFAGKLEGALREKLNATYSVHPRSTYLRGGVAILAASSSIDRGRAAEAMKEIEALTADWADVLPSETDVEEARWAVAKDRALSGYNNEEIATRIADQLSRFEEVRSFEDQAAALRKVDAAAVGTLLRQCREQLVVSLLGFSPELTPGIPATWQKVQDESVAGN